MKRSEINRAYHAAMACFARHHWALPPRPRWDITDFGLGDFAGHGLVLVNLTEEAEYCEKIMYARRGQTTPCHMHAKKKEDLICRAGELTLRIWPARPDAHSVPAVHLALRGDGVPAKIVSGQQLVLAAGSRVTLPPGVWHEFVATSEDCLIGEISTANDDARDNFFLNADIGRFPAIEEDEPAEIRLVTEG